MTYTFEVNENLELYIYDKDQQPEPLIYQPHWPDGTAWADAEEASEWGEAYIESVTNPDSEFLPGSSPDEPLVPRPMEVLEAEIVDTPEENLAIEAE